MPGDSVEALAVRLGKRPDELIRLDLNENPYGTSVRVQEALASFDHYHRYPDAAQRGARRRIAEYASTPLDLAPEYVSAPIDRIPPERIILGNGIDEQIDQILLTTIDPGDEVIVPTPTFEVYEERAPLFGGVVRRVPRTADFDLDLAAIERAVTPRTKLIFVTSPNNPSGNLPSTQQIVRLLRTGALVVLDEAYYEFSGKTHLPLAREFDNLVVLRSFSKWAGLAGMRISYAVFPTALADEVLKVKSPFNLSVAALVAIGAALDDAEYLRGAVNRIRLERARLYRSLRKLNFLQPYPSQGNFILCRVTRGDAHDIHRRLRAQGILVKRYPGPELRDYLRISVGRPEDTDALMRALLAMVEDI